MAGVGFGAERRRAPSHLHRGGDSEEHEDGGGNEDHARLAVVEEPAEEKGREAGAQIKPRVDELLQRTDSHYAAVLVAAKRARQLNSYYRALGEGSYEEYTPPMVDTPSGNYLTIALEELAAGKLKYRYRAG